MRNKLVRTAQEMLSIANDLDDLGLYALSTQLDRRAMRIISAQVPGLVAPNLLDPQQVDEVQQKRDEENEELGDMLEQDEETVEEQQGLLEDHQDDVENPLREIVQQ